MTARPIRVHRIRKRTAIAHERLEDDADAKLRGLLEAGDVRSQERPFGAVPAAETV